MKIGRPQLSDKERKLGNSLYKYLMTKETSITKQEMCNFLGWEYNSSSDRKLRSLLSNIGKVVPLISTSDQKGYFIAKTGKDLTAVEHQKSEISSRIDELEKRKQPLINFLNKFKDPVQYDD